MSSSRKLILVAHADEVRRDELEDALTQANYEVITTSDAEGVSEHLEEFPMIDLLLLDIELPKKGAWEILQHLKRDTSTIDVPVFGLAGDVDSEEIGNLRSLGVEGLIDNSVDMPELLYIVNSCLFPAGRERRQAPRAIAQGPINYTAMGETFQGLLFNISTTGCFIRTELPLAPDTSLNLEINLRGFPRPIRCVGKVARVVVAPQSAGPGEVRGVGVRFTTISPADTELLRSYVDGQLRV